MSNVPQITFPEFLQKEVSIMLQTTLSKFGSFPFVPPVPYAPPFTEHVSLHGISLCKNMARASGGGVANSMNPVFHKSRKDPKTL